MQDSEPQQSETVLGKTFKKQLKSVGGRLVRDVKSIAFSDKGDLNVLGTAAVIGTALYMAPWILTTAGVLSVMSGALDTQEDEEIVPDIETAPDVEACPA